MRSVLTGLFLLLPGLAMAEEVTQFPIAGKLVEVPVVEGFCAATETDMRETPLRRVLGQQMVARTRPLALHLDCAALAVFRSGRVPEAVRARYWSLVAPAPDSLLFDANHLATYEAMLAGLSNATARDLFGKNLVVGVKKENFRPSSIVIETEQNAIGGTVKAEVHALEQWRAVELGMAVLPVRSRLVLTAAVQTGGAFDAGADFAEAFGMLYAIREAK
jgi:hypothetical protein